MSETVRNVRLLDRSPGQATETRVVNGVTIEKGVPLPTRKGYMPVLRALEVGESFLWPKRPHVHEIQKETGRVFEIHAEKNQFRTWRKK